MFSMLDHPRPVLFLILSFLCVFRSKVGGLADVLASLPTALAARYVLNYEFNAEKALYSKPSKHNLCTTVGTCFNF
jgi:hypothetical protein